MSFDHTPVPFELTNFKEYFAQFFFSQVGFSTNGKCSSYTSVLSRDEESDAVIALKCLIDLYCK
jgi:aerobic-type carbon monoxide dehydrogenase small subunit (CoxS/CutS family)